MKAILLCLLIGWHVITIANAQLMPVQKVEGMVRDAQTKAVIPNVHILKENGEGVTTNKEGYFSLDVLGDQQLVITHLGYLTQFYEIPIIDSLVVLSVDIQLYKDTVSLGAVEIFPWPEQEGFKEEFLSLEVPAEQDQRRMLIPGLPQRKGPPIPPPPSIMNPVSLMYSFLSKEAINKRKLRRYRKIILESAQEKSE